MREIKFRAWDKVSHKWIDLSKFPLVIYNDGSGHILLERDSVHGDETLELNEFIEIIQFTGLKDKNRKEIYEGDILKLIDGNGEPYFKEVEWISPYFGFRDLHRDWHDGMFGKGEIIGNKFENPELLK